MEKRKLNPQEIETFKKKLLTKRAELMKDTNEIRKVSLRESSKSDQTGQLSALPTHIADLASDTYEQDMAISQMENGTHIISEIDNALEKIENDQGQYGICEMDDKPISKQRLDVIPWTRYCKDCQTKLE